MSDIVEGQTHAAFFAVPSAGDAARAGRVYPFRENGVIVLGPRVVATPDLCTIVWMGRTYRLVEDSE